MGKIVEVKINRFDKGITNDPREEDTRFSQLIKNFDAHTYPKKLVPFRSFESGDSAASTSQKQNFCVALRTGTTYSLYALGVKSGVTTAEILYKDLATGFTDGTWTAPPANQSSSGATSFNLFVYYQLANLIIGARAGTNLWAFSPSGSAWSDSWQTLSYTNIAQGLVHSKADILYIPYDNKIATYNHTGTVWNATALTLPAHFKITSICEYGNYLAIACAPLSGVGNSKVYLWDRDSSITTLTESIDWGEGSLQILEEIEGHLIGVSSVTQNTFLGKIVFKQYAGGIATPFNELTHEAATTVTILPFKQKVNQYLYFLLSLTLKGTQQRGLWKVGRNSPDKPFALTMDRQVDNTEGNTPTYGFVVIGDYVFISYSSTGGATPDTLSKTDDAANYSLNSLYESVIFNLGDSSLTKKLYGVTVTYEAQPTAGQVTLKYKKDEETSWTTIFTDTTDNAISHSAINIESTGDVLPNFKEIQFQITSTGGTVITGLKFKAEIIDSDIY